MKMNNAEIDFMSESGGKTDAFGLEDPPMSMEEFTATRHQALGRSPKSFCYLRRRNRFDLP